MIKIKKENQTYFILDKDNKYKLNFRGLSAYLLFVSASDYILNGKKVTDFYHNIRIRNYKIKKY